MLSRLPEALYNFLKNQWHEEATEEQLAVLVNHIMEYLEISELPKEKRWVLWGYTVGFPTLIPKYL